MSETNMSDAFDTHTGGRSSGRTSGSALNLRHREWRFPVSPDTERPEPRAECAHERKTFVRTDEDWFDGDEIDVFRCDECGAAIKEYIPR